MTDNIWHVFPIDDSEEHLQKSEWVSNVDSQGNVNMSLYCSCKCRSSVDYLENGGIIVVHDAFDGRLGIEWANEILNK